MTTMLTSMSRISQSSDAGAGLATQITRYQRGASRTVQTTFLIASLTAHSAVLMFILDHQLSEPGRAAQVTEAISVELAASSIIEAAQHEPLKELDASSAASMQSSPPEVTPSPLQPLDTQQLGPDLNQSLAPQTEVKANEASEIISTTDERAVAETHEPKKNVNSEIARSQRQKTPNQKANTNHPLRTDISKRVNKNLPNATDAPRAADHTTRASNRSTASSGRISASKGDVVSYAARVRAQVASRRPNGNGVRGTVVISFSVATSGALGSARIASSSGNAAVDRATLSAVRSAGPFPPPPAGSGTLSFAVPFHYR